MPTLTIHDETMTGRTVSTFTLDVLTEHLTARDLICRRVTEEVREYNLLRPSRFNGLVEPTDAETTLNGSRSYRLIDAEKQVCRALEAFTRNRFFLLVDNRQVEELDAVIEVAVDTQISFVRLVPLVGG